MQLDVGRLRRLAIDAIAALPDEELAERVGVPVTVGPVLRGARTLVEAREFAGQVLARPDVRPDAAAQPTLERFAELRRGAPEALDDGAARELVRERRRSAVTCVPYGSR